MLLFKMFVGKWDTPKLVAYSLKNWVKGVETVEFAHEQTRRQKTCFREQLENEMIVICLFSLSLLLLFFFFSASIWKVIVTNNDKSWRTAEAVFISRALSDALYSSYFQHREGHGERL